MKALCVRQPWASLICSGIKDVENRTWKPKVAPGRILIVASGKKVPRTLLDELPGDMRTELVNHVTYGNLPAIGTLPTSAVLGYVTVEGFEVGNTGSVWDDGPFVIKWILKDAWLFDEPITGVSGKLNLFDYPLDEDNLPLAHKVNCK